MRRLPFPIPTPDWNTSARVITYPGALCCLLWPVPELILAAGLLLFALEMWCFLRQSDRSIDLRVLLRIISLVFMWIAPALSYVFADAGWYTGYRMAVPAGLYFALAIPCTVAFNLALTVPTGAARTFPDIDSRAWGWSLLAVGVLTQQVVPHVEIPAGLRHPLYLTGQLWLVGLLFLQQAYPTRRWWLFGAAVAYLLLDALHTTLFGYMMVWAALLLCYTLRPGEVRFRYRLSAALLLAMAALFVLSFKYEYRQKIWHEQATEPRWQIFLSLAGQRLTHPADLWRPDIIQHYTDRLNQGYHTAMCMAYVPANEPFARGATLLDDVRSALLPRFLAPGKQRAGGAENIRRFSGVSGQRWSSNIGHYGEAYVNFGTGGAWLVMLLYGLFIGAAWWGMRRFFPLPWWPFVLQPVLNVEEDIGMGLNHIVKAVLFAVLVAAIAGLWKRARLTRLITDN